MRRLTIPLAMMLIVGLSAGAGAMGRGKGKPQPVPCPSDVGVALALQCPCAGATQAETALSGWRNHGQYVKCVVQFRNALRKSGCLTSDEKRTIARCAARSTCGKDTALCCHYGIGTCSDPMPGDMIAAGTCSNQPTVACDVSSDCTTSTSSIVADAAKCTADGGAVVDGGGSVCAPCPPPTTTTTTLP